MESIHMRSSPCWNFSAIGANERINIFQLTVCGIVLLRYSGFVSNNPFDHQRQGPTDREQELEQMTRSGSWERVYPAPRREGIPLFPILLFLATCYTTRAQHGWAYSVAVMTILLCHEMGHYLQARRYGVPASLPFFIPMPGSITGTMGAVILMQPGRGDRRQIFDIAVSGPIAGLIPSIIFSLIGLRLSQVVPLADAGVHLTLGEPLVFKLLSYLALGPLPPGQDVFLHPVAFAGWVGIFITALNLIPIGQLDGGHTLYALLLQRAYPVAQGLLLAAVVAVFAFGYWGWSIMVLLLLLMGPIHPPTANDNIPLGTGRTILGWACLAFVPLGFTPTPFS
jgi:Zn-dependent protease